jgi:hypothetical protein
LQLLDRARALLEHLGDLFDGEISDDAEQQHVALIGDEPGADRLDPFGRHETKGVLFDVADRGATRFVEFLVGNRRPTFTDVAQLTLLERVIKEEETGGMRHQTAARLVHRNHDAMVITVSQDGPVSLFVWDHKDAIVVVIKYLDRYLLADDRFER